MIQGDYTHETREYGKAFIQNLQARIRELETALKIAEDNAEIAQEYLAKAEQERNDLQARIRKLEATLTGMTWERDAIKDYLERSREMNRVRTTQLDGMSDAYEKSSQGRARDWREHETKLVETQDELGHLRMRIMQFQRER